MDNKEGISVIIPVYNEAKIIGQTLSHLQKSDGYKEVIVVDGKSTDATRSIILKYHPEVKLIEASKRGRAHQMNKGARIARGKILFFLHADSLPPFHAPSLIRDQLNQAGTIAASFRLRFDDPSWIFHFMAFFSRWNTLLMTYGDQGLVLRKRIFEEIGGYRPIPIFEDLEIQLRLRKRGRFVKIKRPITTSARRFKKRGLFRQLLINTVLVLAWRAGVHPKVLTKYYPYQD